MNRYASWSVGCNVVHNQNEKWTVKEFQTKSVSDDGRRALLLIIAAGVGFAEYMLADGSNANLATARTQQLPAIKRFSDKQDSYGFIFSLILEFMIKVGVKYNNVKASKKETEYIPTIIFPPIIEADDKTETDTTIAELNNGIISKKTARNILGRSDDFENKQIAKELEYETDMTEIKNELIVTGDFNKAKNLLIALEEKISVQMQELSSQVNTDGAEILINDI
jgi:hypothetical protein